MSADVILVNGNELRFAGKTYRCAIGPGGITDSKQEGDGKTPSGIYLLRECFYRPDRLSAPNTALPLKALSSQDGWCDDTKDPNYNRFVKLPYAASHENLWREDHVYDVIVPIGYNDDPPIAGKGSAIFMHIARPDYSPTEGCVALSLPDILELLASITTDTKMQIGS